MIQTTPATGFARRAAKRRRRLSKWRCRQERDKRVCGNSGEHTRSTDWFSSPPMRFMAARLRRLLTTFLTMRFGFVLPGISICCSCQVHFSEPGGTPEPGHIANTPAASDGRSIYKKAVAAHSSPKRLWPRKR
jgi:hypothetical protein